uniref:Uncharacterized protein n=1 Tax=Arundo donax TaxID=35708 RepID=A0A0A9BVJ2_ARUDO
MELKNFSTQEMRFMET